MLAAVPDPALVLLGAPGSGKSTLLQYVEVDYAGDALDGSDPAPNPVPLPFCVSLNLYKAAAGDKLPSPKTWLEQHWAARTDRYPGLPPLDALLRAGRLVLLLDALNEMPHQRVEHIDAWRDFLARLVEERPGNRVIFSCRTLDYGAKLSTKSLPVPQVRIEPLSDPQVEEFIEKYGSRQAGTLWEALRRQPRQLDLYRSPYYLKLLVDQAGPEGQIPLGRAALFSGFVRQALNREMVGKHPLFEEGVLLAAEECKRMAGNAYTGCELPTENPLFLALSALAYRMQETEQNPEASQVRLERVRALAVLGTTEPATAGLWVTLTSWLRRETPDLPRAERILEAGLALHVLTLDEKQKDVLFFHQLLQEYFAARRLAARPHPRLLRVPWRARQVRPTLEATLAGLADSDPLPPLPGTGWEETAVLAAAMAIDADAFVADLMAANLALAGRCAAQPDVAVSDTLKDSLRRALIERTGDPAADLRARIAAGLALGELGDPRWQRCRGPHGDYLLPPLIAIPGGAYPIGSDEGHYEDEAPVHAVDLQPFQLGQFPVTHAEYALFIKAGGYEDERWWDTDAARAWQCGESTAEGAKQQWRENRQTLQAQFDDIRDWQRQGRITSKQADDWEQIARMDDDAFEALLEDWYPPGRQTQPALWNDEAFNNPAQPVVGISWFEARAYCAWLSAQTGQPFRLPSEAEWEAAARGRDGRRYAYGDTFDAKLCNAFESHIRRTTPVGVFPGGETPEGLIDLTGNTWDWTGSKYQPYPYDAADGREDPVGVARRVV
ncbi:MAG: SUMF1/EgtB/PvdO family nonheme iron enzyme, partial [Candidatus Competibacter phosphatis]